MILRNECPSTRTSTTEAYSEPSQTSKVELFAKVVKRFEPGTTPEKYSILDAWQVSDMPMHCLATWASLCLWVY